MIDLQQIDYITATYRPARADDLQEWAVPWVGFRATWTVAWWIEEGQFAGQWACIPQRHDEHLPPFGWAPLSDLVDVEGVEP